MFAIGLFLMDSIDLTMHTYNDATTQRLLALCDRCMAPNRHERPASAGEVLELFIACFPQIPRVTAQRPALAPPPDMGQRWNWRLVRGRGVNALAALAATACMVLLLPPHGCHNTPESVANAPTAEETSPPQAAPPTPPPEIVATAEEPPVVQAALELKKRDESCAASPTTPPPEEPPAMVVAADPPKSVEEQPTAQAKKAPARKRARKRRRRHKQKNKNLFLGTEKIQNASGSGIFMGVAP